MEKSNEGTAKSVDDILYEAATSDPVSLEAHRIVPASAPVTPVETTRAEKVPTESADEREAIIVDDGKDADKAATEEQVEAPAEDASVPGSIKADSYFEDDEIAVEQANDEVIYSDELSSIFQQADDVVAVEVKNFYTDNGKPRSRFAMRNDPPVLSIRSGSEQYASFVLTEHFAQYLVSATGNVDRAYQGKEPLLLGEKEKKPVSFKDSFQRSVEYIANHPMKSLLAALVVGLIIYGLIRF